MATGQGRMMEGIIPVRSVDFELYWPRAKPFIESARARGCERTLVQIEDEIRAGRYLLVCVVIKGQMLGALTIEQGGRCINVAQIGADRLHTYINHLVEFLVNLARVVGKVEITGRGRKGWGPKLAPYGFEKRGKFYVLNIEGE